MPESLEARRCRLALARATKHARKHDTDPAAARALTAARQDYATARGLDVLNRALTAVDALGLTDAGRGRLVDTLAAEPGDRVAASSTVRT